MYSYRSGARAVAVEADRTSLACYRGSWRNLENWSRGWSSSGPLRRQIRSCGDAPQCAALFSIGTSVRNTLTAGELWALELVNYILKIHVTTHSVLIRYLGNKYLCIMESVLEAATHVSLV